MSSPRTLTIKTRLPRPELWGEGWKLSQIDAVEPYLLSDSVLTKENWNNYIKWKKIEMSISQRGELFSILEKMDGMSWIEGFPISLAYRLDLEIAKYL